MLWTYDYGVSIEIHDDLIREFDITEDDFRPIRNLKDDIIYYQITPIHVMKPIGAVNRYRELKPCRKCGSVQFREKVYLNVKEWEYSFITKEALEDMHDINISCEAFMRFSRNFVISRRVYDHLTAKYPRMTFRPMFLKEE